MEQRPAPVTLDHCVNDHMPALAPRPSTPCTPAEIVRGTPRWPGVLVLRPVTVFGPSYSPNTIGTPGSEISELIQTPEEEQRELELNVSGAERAVDPVGDAGLADRPVPFAGAVWFRRGGWRGLADFALL